MSHIVVSSSSSTEYSEPLILRPLGETTIVKVVHCNIVCFDHFTATNHEAFILCLSLVVVQWNSFWAATDSDCPNEVVYQREFNCIFTINCCTVKLILSGHPPDWLSKQGGLTKRSLTVLFYFSLDGCFYFVWVDWSRFFCHILFIVYYSYPPS